MAKTIIRAHMKQRRDTADNWRVQNPILLDGEIGIVTDQPERYKVGDGVTEWNALPLRGFDGNIVQMTGGSRTAVMSQLAVTQALEEVENNALSPEKIEELTKVLASKAELNEAINTLTEAVVENEEVTAAALNDLNTRVNDSATKGDIQTINDAFANYPTKTEIAESLESLTTEIVANEEVTAAALNDLNDKKASKEDLANAIAEAITQTLNTAV